VVGGSGLEVVDSTRVNFLLRGSEKQTAEEERCSGSSQSGRGIRTLDLFCGKEVLLALPELAL